MANGQHVAAAGKQVHLFEWVALASLHHNVHPTYFSCLHLVPEMCLGNKGNISGRMSGQWVFFYHKAGLHKRIIDTNNTKCCQDDKITALFKTIHSNVLNVHARPQIRSACTKCFLFNRITDSLGWEELSSWSGWGFMHYLKPLYNILAGDSQWTSTSLESLITSKGSYSDSWDLLHKLNRNLMPLLSHQSCTAIQSAKSNHQ